MEQFEKVCKGLECCLPETQEQAELSCAACPYDPCGVSVSLPISLIDDVRKLITAQQERIKELEAARTARVMTLEELDAIYQTKEMHTWPFNTPPYLWMTVNPDVRQTRGFWICWRDIMYCFENSSPFYVRENYGKVWKIWTAEPTDGQRKAAKWDERV